MTGHVMAATDADGTRIAERTTSTAPSLREAAAYGDSNLTNYVSVRHGQGITLYGRSADGTWSVLVADAPAPVVVELRREHDASHRGSQAGEGGAPSDEFSGGPVASPAYDPPGEPPHAYALIATDVARQPLGERRMPTPPALADAAELGDLHHANYVTSCPRDSDLMTLYGRDAEGSWATLAVDVDTETAEEVCLWFDLTQHYPDPGGRTGHPLDHLEPPAGGELAEARAVTRVGEHVRAHGLDYPTRGLVADRFDGGWSVYAPVEVDDSDPMSFLDMPVGRSVFLVSDLGRVKEVTSSVPPPLVERMFTAEEAYVRRRSAAEEFTADLRDHFLRLDAEAGGIGRHRLVRHQHLRGGDRRPRVRADRPDRPATGPARPVGLGSLHCRVLLHRLPRGGRTSLLDRKTQRRDPDTGATRRTGTPPAAPRRPDAVRTVVAPGALRDPHRRHRRTGHRGVRLRRSAPPRRRPAAPGALPGRSGRLPAQPDTGMAHRVRRR